MKRQIVFLTIVALLYLGVYFFNKYAYKDLDRNPRYVVGVITNKLVSKSGASYTCAFTFRKKANQTRFSGLRFGVGDKVLIKIQEDDPSINEVLSSYLLSSSFQQTNFSDSVWQEIPLQYFSRK